MTDRKGFRRDSVQAKIDHIWTDQICEFWELG